MQELISVIIPIYNVDKYLERCVNSIIEQTYENLEIILVDDGSKDKSPQICDSYEKKDRRIKVIHKENSGVSETRNIGIKQSTGKYILFVDADDYLEKDMIMCLYNTLTDNKVDIVRGNYYISNGSDNKIKGNTYGLANRVLDRNDIVEKLIPNLLESKIQCYVWLLLISREKINKIDEFDKELYILEDTLFYINLLLKADSIYILDIPLYNYNIANISSATKSSKYYVRNMKNMINVNKKIREAIQGIESQKNNYIEIIDTRHFSCIINYIYMIYKSEKKLENGIKEFDKIRDCDEIELMLKNYNPKLVDMQMRIQISLVLKKRYKILKLFYLFRILLSRIKK